jgi:hypothetical protein
MTDRNDSARATDLDRRIAQAPTEIAPPNDLWPRIAAAIDSKTAALDELGRRLPKDRLPPTDLWPAIRARLAAETRARQPVWPRWWILTAGGIAAALALGVFIGRQSAQRGDSDFATPIVAEVAPRESALPAAYRRAVGEHLREAETVLVLFNSAAEPDAELVGLARELAATSRLLTASRAGEDPEVRAMLLDLELLLMQVARVVDDDAIERQVVREGTADAAVLARLRLMIAMETERTGI